MMWRFILTVLCGFIVVATAWAASPSSQPAAGEIALEGTFVWNNKPNDTHPLRATLTSTGTNEWKAVWSFQWNNKPMTYVGTVRGDIKNGEVTGTGKTTEGKERSFIFEGTAKDGVTKMQHYEVTNGRKATGHGEFRVSK